MAEAKEGLNRSEPLTRRVPGAMEGQIWIANDFDALSPDVLAAMGGRKEWGG